MANGNGRNGVRKGYEDELAKRSVIGAYKGQLAKQEMMLPEERRARKATAKRTTSPTKRREPTPTTGRTPSIASRPRRSRDAYADAARAIEQRRAQRGGRRINL